MNRMLLLALLAFLLSACGGSSSNSGSGDEDRSQNDPPESNDVILTGTFIDSAVEGLEYFTPTLNGVTNQKGDFQYRPGETVSFRVGGIELGTVNAESALTPLDFAPLGASSTHPRVVNIARFLQTLDTDLNPDNGISISGSVRAAAVGVSLDFDVGAAAFENAPALLSFLASLSPERTLRDHLDASRHLQENLSSAYKDLPAELLVLTSDTDEANIAAHSDGSSLVLLDKQASDTTRDIVFTNASGERSVITLNEQGLPIQLYAESGLVIVFENYSKAFVDVAVSVPGLETILHRAVLDADEHSLYSQIVAINGIELPEELADNTASEASQGDSTLLISAAMAISLIEYLTDGIEIPNVDTEALYFEKKLVSDTRFRDILEGKVKVFVIKMFAAALLDDEYDLRAIEVAISTLQCVRGNPDGCGDAVVKTAKSLIEIGGALYDIYQDKERLAAMQARIDAFDWQNTRPFVEIAGVKDGG
ncbi:MAG: hypothetical protein MI976_26000, partial [Pseudomonadales bacterium]|nr:hypothetical protein [Pseudomonadales bacterium]